MKTSKFFGLLAVTALAVIAVSAQAAGYDIAALMSPEMAASLSMVGAAGMINYQQKGEVITITAGATYTSGQVIALGNMLGVAAGDIANGAVGEVALKGVFTVPKVAGAVIAQGQTLTWDASAAAFDDNAAVPAAGDITGAACFAFEAAGAGPTSLAVCFTGTPGTLN
jgi:predicted RecA/RadA family phage recombinase